MKHILIVEDDFIIYRSMGNYLTKLGYKITAGLTDHREIIEVLKKEHCDLILMCTRLNNGLDGIEIMSEIRSFSAIPVIYLTEITNEQVRKKAEKTNPAGFLTKPFRYEDLKNAVEYCWHSRST